MFHQANAALEQHRVFQLQLAEKAQKTRLTPKGVLQSALLISDLCLYNRSLFSLLMEIAMG